MVRQDTLRNRAKKLCPESRRTIQIRELARKNRNLVFARLVATAAFLFVVFGLIFFIYFPLRDNVSLLRAFKAIFEFVVDRLLVQFINLFCVSFCLCGRLNLFCNSRSTFPLQPTLHEKPDSLFLACTRQTKYQSN